MEIKHVGIQKKGENKINLMIKVAKACNTLHKMNEENRKSF
jgi:hypothetical protein